jgi:hypothetical protein
MILPVKTLVCSESGGGKTGLNASLAAAGYNLRMLDLDNNSRVLFSLLNDPESPYVKADPRVSERLQSVIGLSEKRTASGGKLGMARAEVWSKACGLLEKWKDGEKDFGSIVDWTTQDVLIVDSFTRLGDAAMRFVQAMNGRLNQHPWQSDYGEAQGLLKSFLEIIADPTIKCNVVINCHIASVEDGDGVSRDYPKAPGKAIAKDIATYFGSLLYITKTGVGVNVKRVLRTVPTGTLGVKNTAPFRVPPEYPIESGLASYFAAVRGEP